MGTNMVNLPVPAYTRGAEVRALIEANWIPALEAFRPQMVFVSAGFDPHREADPGQLGLVEADYAWNTQRTNAVSRRHAPAPPGSRRGGRGTPRRPLGQNKTGRVPGACPRPGRRRCQGSSRPRVPGTNPHRTGGPCSPARRPAGSQTQPACAGNARACVKGTWRPPLWPKREWRRRVALLQSSHARPSGASGTTSARRRRARETAPSRGKSG